MEPLLAATLALAVAGPLVAWGPPGVDVAAHLYQVHSAKTALWDNLWYSGSYSYVTYSLLWAPLAMVVGVLPLALGSIAVGVGAFAGFAGRVWGPAARWSTRVFGLAWAGTALSGDYPFMLGAALGLAALWALVTWWPNDGPPRRTGRALPNACFGLLALLTLASSPLAFLALALVVAIAALVNGRRWLRVIGPLATVVALGSAEVLLTRAFPGDSTYPFWVADLAWIGGFCALGTVMTWRVPRARALTFMFVSYGLLSLVIFTVPTPVGAMMARLRYAAVPVMVLAAGVRNWRPRGACLAAIVAAGAWSVPPMVTFLAGAKTGVASKAAYWAPAVAYLNSHLTPSYRVEAIDTSGHWPAYHLAGAGIPLVRGWFRSDDFPTNSLLYRTGPLTSSSYLAWLRGLGVEYVVRTDSPPDFSSAAEDRLLLSGHSGLTPTMRSTHLTVYAVPHPQGIATGPGPASVVSLSRNALSVRVPAPGTYRLAVHWTPYWHASAGCVTRAADGMTTLVAARAGVDRLSFDVNPSRALQAMVRDPPPSCPSA